MDKKKIVGWIMFLYQFIFVSFAVAWGIYSLFNNDPSDDVFAWILLPVSIIGFILMPAFYRNIRR